MEEELLKRNTDCVYFLASPLTCKKGIDCEYRHNEIARLNPRDCWYWLAGKCLNPTCAFRHPPLDLHPKESSETSICSQSVNKTNIPCYFYFNGFCNKGYKCCFLHGVDYTAPAAKPVKAAPAEGNAPAEKSVNVMLVNSDPLLENKESKGTDAVSVPISMHLSFVETAENAAVDTGMQPKRHFQVPVSSIAPQQSASPEISVSEDDDPGATGSDSQLEDGFIQSVSHVSTDQSSEEEMDDHIDQDERWESSPGFDVLVDGKSENMHCDGDPEYFMALDSDQRELNCHFLGYDCENPILYDSTCRDVELIYEREVYDSYDHRDKAYIRGNIRNIPGHANDTTLNPVLSHKRKLMPMELVVDDQNCVDLRNYLRRRKIIDSHPVSGLARRHGSSRLMHKSQERRQRHGIGRRQLRGNLALELGKHSIESDGKNGSLLNGRNLHSSFRHRQQRLSRMHYKENKLAGRQFPSSEISRKPKMRKRMHKRESNDAFSGPKTLAQIKEEKNKAEANGDWIGKVRHLSRMTSADFEGPKPLSEILEDKRKMRNERVSTSST